MLWYTTWKRSGGEEGGGRNGCRERREKEWERRRKLQRVGKITKLGTVMCLHFSGERTWYFKRRNSDFIPYHPTRTTTMITSLLPQVWCCRPLLVLEPCWGTRPCWRERCRLASSLRSTCGMLNERPSSDPVTVETKWKWNRCKRTDTAIKI